MEKEIEKSMQKTIDALRVDMGKIRTGRVHVGLLDDIVVNCYGSNMPLSKIASVRACDSQTLLISPWNNNNMPAIEKSISESDLDLNPSSSSSGIRVSMPPMTEERRKTLVKIIGKEVEGSKIALRNIRRDAIFDVKNKVKSGEMSEDEGRRMEQEIQKITNLSVGAADNISEEKKKELLVFDKSISGR